MNDDQRAAFERLAEFSTAATRALYGMLPPETRAEIEALAEAEQRRGYQGRRAGWYPKRPARTRKAIR